MSGFLLPLVTKIQRIQNLVVFSFFQTWSCLLPNRVDKRSPYLYTSVSWEKLTSEMSKASIVLIPQRHLSLPNWNPIIAKKLQVVLLPGTEYFGWDIKDKCYGIMASTAKRTHKVSVQFLPRQFNASYPTIDLEAKTWRFHCYQS